MCVAGLNVTTQSCEHRWYELIRSCGPENNLENCAQRLKLEGWERRKEDCPFCEGGDHHQSTHKLFGSTSSASSIASSPTTSDLGCSGASRRESNATMPGAMGPLSRSSTNNSIAFDRASRARDMNERVHLYLSSHPHEVLPSANKYYPTYAAAILRAEDAAANSTDSPALKRIRRRRQSFSQGWKRMSHRFSMTSSMFKGV